MTAQFKIGDQVVVFCGSSPCSHNSREFPRHNCRGTVLSIGRKYYKVSSIGAPLKIAITNDELWHIMSVEDAKIVYAKSFGGPNDYRTPEFIAQCIRSL